MAHHFQLAALRDRLLIGSILVVGRFGNNLAVIHLPARLQTEPSQLHPTIYEEWPLNSAVSNDREYTRQPARHRRVHTRDQDS